MAINMKAINNRIETIYYHSSFLISGSRQNSNKNLFSVLPSQIQATSDVLQVFFIKDRRFSSTSDETVLIEMQFNVVCSFEARKSSRSKSSLKWSNEYIFVSISISPLNFKMFKHTFFSDINFNKINNKFIFIRFSDLIIITNS